MSDIIEQLKEALANEGVLTGDDVTSRGASNWGIVHNVIAKAIIRPQNTEQVSQALRICHTAGQTVVTHGGLTGVVGGTTSTENDIVLSLERMNQIEGLDRIGRTMTVQAGVVLQSLQEEAEAAGYLFPLDLGARGSCMIGGNVATNAGGNRVIRYGMTRALVLGLEVVLADGTVVSSLNKMIKNNAGYDLKQIFIGSEGTLGVITRVVLRLMPQPKSQSNAFVAIECFDKVLTLLPFLDEALGGQLSAFEVMWKDFYALVTSPPAHSKPPLPYNYPHYALVESLGADQEEDSARFQKALDEALQKGLISEAVVAQTRRERADLWAMRDDVQQVWRHDPVFLFDVSLAITDMKQYVKEVHEGLSERWPDQKCFTFGHLGDGNLHFLISAGQNDESTRREVERCVYGPLRKIGGSTSAEHGVGLEKKRYLSWSRSQNEIALMRTLKKALDPTDILNPGKIFD